MYRILIVEDDPGIAEAVARQAALWELEARCVKDFRNVLGEFRDFAPHLVVLDISLPFFNGYLSFLGLGQYEYRHGDESRRG